MAFQRILMLLKYSAEKRKKATGGGQPISHTKPGPPPAAPSSDLSTPEHCARHRRDKGGDRRATCRGHHGRRASLPEVWEWKGRDLNTDGLELINPLNSVPCISKKNIIILHFEKPKKNSLSSQYIIIWKLCQIGGWWGEEATGKSLNHQILTQFRKPGEPRG